MKTIEALKLAEKALVVGSYVKDNQLYEMDHKVSGEARGKISELIEMIEGSKQLEVIIELRIQVGEIEKMLAEDKGSATEGSSPDKEG